MPVIISLRLYEFSAGTNRIATGDLLARADD
jgi:hypothetical protein